MMACKDVLKLPPRAKCSHSNPNYSGGRDWEDSWFEASLGKNFSKTPPESVSRVWWCVPVIPVMQEAR
jgi:hypothetical protein